MMLERTAEADFVLLYTKAEDLGKAKTSYKSSAAVRRCFGKSVPLEDTLLS